MNIFSKTGETKVIPLPLLLIVHKKFYVDVIDDLAKLQTSVGGQLIFVL